ncbi:hypothetical protein CSB93_4821 [Pseudomonas paraeruginosa]|uniref:Uncharacterized protein n=1 Tax=Pseudomonas paraeruginosa TaxID=2994495 RepID=A0A2R3IRC1_9PSED|nr:hypothetical protein CSB93_4821 [Pseudomonas paraeruginosa]AWE93938.1 hypothetical protein CSC28_3611 [Pseudomonas paraeruginosa]
MSFLSAAFKSDVNKRFSFCSCKISYLHLSWWFDFPSELSSLRAIAKQAAQLFLPLCNGVAHDGPQ